MTRAVDLCSGVSLLGQHRRPDSHTLPRRPYGSLVRAFAASGALALSVWSLNLAGGVQERTAAAGPGGGTALSASPDVAPALSGRQGDAPSGTVGPSTLPATIVTDPQALVPFPRPVLGSYAGDKPLPVSVGAAGLGRPPAGFLRAPLELLNPSSPFGFRVSPLSGAANDFHLGQDYAAPCGTKVYAADSGVVRAAGWHPWGGGNRVEIDHGNGLITTYNHLEAIAVRTGDRINVGQFIAEVGTTGWSTGCHLHFETILNGRHVSPLTWGLLPVHPLADDRAEELRSYAPGSGSPLGWLQWIIPVSFGPDDHDGQGAAAAAAAPASPPSAAQVAAPSTQPSSAPPGDPSPTASPTQAAASPGDPSPTASPTQAAASPGDPSPTASPTQAAASPGDPSPTASPTQAAASPGVPSPTAPPTQAAASPGVPSATASPTQTAASPGDPSATASPTQVAASPGDPSPTATASPTQTAASPGDPSPTATPSPTQTTAPPDDPSPTATPTMTPSPNQAATLTPTPTITQTPIPALTPTPTQTPTPALAPTPTQTPPPALTPTPTQTPIPALTPTPTQTPILALTPTPAGPDPATVGPPSAAPSPTATESTSTAGTAPAGPSIGAACLLPGETAPGNLPRKHPDPTSTLADRQRISPDEQLPEDPACDIPVPDPADPE
ncbi:murein DD-endopeptidase MepM/ murein hydrolase activator NlpD [Pseudarthrobacter sp. W1I19]|nr:murein DD-endopeptidase MepM/ murein hydrolase activator NlpD [Pseudarthrobacter sp. W1I19]